MKMSVQKYELARANACMSVSELHRKTGIARTTLNRAVAGRNVRPEILGKIARALGVNVTEIIDTDN